MGLCLTQFTMILTNWLVGTFLADIKGGVNWCSQCEQSCITIACVVSSFVLTVVSRVNIHIHELWLDSQSQYLSNSILYSQFDLHLTEIWRKHLDHCFWTFCVWLYATFIALSYLAEVVIIFLESLAFWWYTLHVIWSVFGKAMTKTLEYFRAGLFFLSGFRYISARTQWIWLNSSVKYTSQSVLSYYSTLTAGHTNLFFRITTLVEMHYLLFSHSV